MQERGVGKMETKKEAKWLVGWWMGRFYVLYWSESASVNCQTSRCQIAPTQTIYFRTEPLLVLTIARIQRSILSIFLKDFSYQTHPVSNSEPEKASARIRLLTLSQVHGMWGSE